MSLEKFSDYLLLEKKYSVHTATAYIKDLESFQCFLDNDYNEDYSDEEYENEQY